MNKSYNSKGRPCHPNTLAAISALRTCHICGKVGKLGSIGTHIKFHDPNHNIIQFLGRVQVDDGCWFWTGAKHRYGYGACVKINGHTRAHRAMWTLLRGPIPEGKVLCHSCDTKLCVNPAHMFVGTQADNMIDAAQKGLMPRGERSRHKLTEAQVREIRGLKGTMWQKDVAKKYGISLSYVSHIWCRLTWKHLQ